MSAAIKEKEQPADAVGTLQVTKEKLRDWSACTDGYQWFLKKFPQGAAFCEVHAELRADRRYADSDWLTDHVFRGLCAVDITRELVSITGANRNKIVEHVKKDGGAESATATTGEGANAATTGEGANAATTGDWANAATTGDWANAATTGEGANAATTGYWANAATTGDRANAATTGEGANAATTGEGANAATTGKHAVAVCLGFNSKAMAGEDGAVILKWWDEKANRPRLAIGYAGENGIKAGTWYSVSDTGELVEEGEAAK